MRKLVAWWIRMHRLGASSGLRRAYEAFQRVQQARADREILARLDARSLRDIGLETSDSDLAQRVQAQRHAVRVRLAAARIGAF